MLPDNPIPAVCDYAIAAQYKALPNEEQLRTGVVPLDSLPAAWWNCMWYDTNRAVNCARDAVGALISEMNTVLTCAGVCACRTCVDQLYRAIENIRVTVGNAVTAGAVKSSSCGGQVTIENDGTMTMNGVGNAAQLTTVTKNVVGAINELKSTYDCCISDLNTAVGGKAPTGHASSSNTYGVGTCDLYGHLKICDVCCTCLGGEADGLAASQASVYGLYDCIAHMGSGVELGNTAGCALGTASAGSATTAARSDHVHPTPSVVNCAYCISNSAGTSWARIYYG